MIIILHKIAKSYEQGRKTSVKIKLLHRNEMTQEFMTERLKALSS